MKKLFFRKEMNFEWLKAHVAMEDLKTQETEIAQIRGELLKYSEFFKRGEDRVDEWNLLLDDLLLDDLLDAFFGRAMPFF